MHTNSFVVTFKIDFELFTLSVLWWSRFWAADFARSPLCSRSAHMLRSHALHIAVVSGWTNVAVTPWSDNHQMRSNLSSCVHRGVDSAFYSNSASFWMTEKLQRRPSDLARFVYAYYTLCWYLKTSSDSEAAGQVSNCWILGWTKTKTHGAGFWRETFSGHYFGRTEYSKPTINVKLY